MFFQCFKYESLYDSIVSMPNKLNKLKSWYVKMTLWTQVHKRYIYIYINNIKNQRQFNGLFVWAPTQIFLNIWNHHIYQKIKCFLSQTDTIKHNFITQ